MRERVLVPDRSIWSPPGWDRSGILRKVLCSMQMNAIGRGVTGPASGASAAVQADRRLSAAGSDSPRGAGNAVTAWRNSSITPPWARLLAYSISA